MSYKPRSLFGLIEDIDNKQLLLPHIQRPFVWEEQQMRRLFDSLMRNYPIQTFLFWRTKDPIKVREFMPCIDRDRDLHDLYNEQKSQGGIEKVLVLDGQQRLQTLYALFNGRIAGGDASIQMHAYVDLSAGETPNEDGLIYDVKFSVNHLPLPHYPLRDLLGCDAQKNAETIAERINDELDTLLKETEDARKPRQKRVRNNCSQMRSLLREENHFWVQQLDGVADAFPYKTILDIFVRVNSGGTKLDAGDLMFAAMKEGWAEIEENVEEIAELLNNKKLSFDKSFVLKCLVVAHGKGAELSPEKFAPPGGAVLLKTIEDNWQKAEEAFQQLRDFIENQLKLYSDKVVRSYGSFIPLFDYLYQNPKPNERNRLLMGAYYYKSQLFNWYGARTDNLINVIHGIITKSDGAAFPLAEITNYFGSSRQLDTQLKLEHLADIRIRYIILNLIYVERFGASPFNVRYRSNEPHIDHIYPQSALRTLLGLGTDEVNSIGNYRFLGASDNIRKRAEKPAEYFARLKHNQINIENHLLLPDVSASPGLLKFDPATYRDFRDRRLQAIFEIASRVVNPEMTSDDKPIPQAAH